MKTIGLLLANGRSTRFGDKNKLLANLCGRSIISYAADAMRRSQFDQLLVVTRSVEIIRQLGDFEVVLPQNDTYGQGDSVSLGVKTAANFEADRVVIVLADMPFIDSAILSQVLSTCIGSFPSAVSDGKRITPPACFPSSYFKDLIALYGDRGAANLLKSLPSDNLVHVPERALFDVDTPENLSAIQK